MKAVMWRALYAIVCFALAMWILPLLLTFFKIPIAGAWPLIQALMGGIAILYIAFGPEPRYPW